jgi:hypothetical protein
MEKDFQPIVQETEPPGELPGELAGVVEAGPGGPPPASTALLPGMVAIALYMLVLAGVLTLGVAGGHYSPMLLVAAALFVAASFGLLRLFRWAWALTLSAVFLLMSYHFLLFAHEKQMPSVVQAGLNLVFFFYLVRVDVRSRLR